MRSVSMWILAALTVYSSLPAMAQSQWQRYNNFKFGVSIEVPLHLFQNPVEPPLGDGIHYVPNADGATLSIWGSYNTMETAPYSDLCNSGCLGETYRVDQKRMGVSSGFDGGIIFYKKCLLTGSEKPGLLHCFEIKYPITKRRVYDSVAERLSGSLR